MVLEVKNLTKKFSQGDKEVSAAENISFTMPQGAFVNIIGRSGSGKSTLLNLIAGILEPTTGDILLDGKSIVGLSDIDASRMRNEQIGYVMQGNAALSNLTIWENVCLPHYLFPRKNDVSKTASELLEQVGIASLKNAYPARLSGGELKRMAIARALVNHPALLLADEPTGDLDKENTEAIMKLFRQIADQGTSVIVVTHELENLRYGDKVYRMEDGKLSEVEN